MVREENARNMKQTVIGSCAMFPLSLYLICLLGPTAAGIKLRLNYNEISLKQSSVNIETSPKSQTFLSIRSLDPKKWRMCDDNPRD